MPYSNAEMTDMVLIYGKCDESAYRAAAEYRRRFPNRQNMPNPRTFVRIVQSLRDSGTLHAPAITTIFTTTSYNVNKLENRK